MDDTTHRKAENGQEEVWGGVGVGRWSRLGKEEDGGQLAGARV